MKRFFALSLRSKILLGCCVFILCIIVIEFALRFGGEIPGYTGAMSGEYLDLKKVNKLIATKYFLTDSTGLFKANPDTVFYNPQITINEDGFRGRRLVADDSVKKKKVLFIGDSFTWAETQIRFLNVLLTRLSEPVSTPGMQGFPEQNPTSMRQLQSVTFPF